VSGQIIGGALVESDLLGLGWRSCFLINVPVGLAALALTPRLVPESRAPSRARIDLAGALALGVALVAVLLPLIQGRQAGWPLWTWLSFGAGAIVSSGFLVRQGQLTRSGAAPLVDLALFSRRSFSAGLVVQLVLAAAQAAFFVYLALYLQQGRGLGALEAGLVFTILAASYVATSGPAPALTARLGRAVVAVGGAVLAAGLGVLAVVVGDVGTGGSIAALVPGLVLVGAGIGLCYTPLTSIVLTAVDPRRAGAASGVMATTQQVGYALGVAVTGLIFFGSGDDLGHAFALSAAQLGATAAVIVVATGFLPARRAARAAGAPEPAGA
jgi:MFS family permease